MQLYAFPAKGILKENSLMSTLSNGRILPSTFLIAQNDFFFATNPNFLQQSIDILLNESFCLQNGHLAKLFVIIKCRADPYEYFFQRKISSISSPCGSKPRI